MGHAYLKIIEATTILAQKIIDKNLIFLNWSEHAKNQAISLICS